MGFLSWWNLSDWRRLARPVNAGIPEWWPPQSYSVLPNEAECLRMDAEALVRDRTRKRVIERMAAQIERELYPSSPSEADQAMAYVKGFAHDLASAASALKAAAERLKKKGDSYGARSTYTAALQADAQVKALLGEEP